MHEFDKAKLLKEKHIKVVIEWGGTDMFTNISEMSIEGVTELLRVLSLEKEYIEPLITNLIKSEYEKY